MKTLLKFFLFCLIGIVVAILGAINWTIAPTYPQPNILLAQIPITSPTPKDQQPQENTVPATPNLPRDEEQPVERSDQQTSDRQSTATRSSTPVSPSGGPYDTKAIEEFYKSLYGS
jgi:hypothetical protein